MRSTLYVPGDQPEKMAKALRANADGVICDLEDAVASSKKAEARATVAEFIRSPAPTKVLVRINFGTPGLDDLRACIPDAGPSFGGIYVPKVSTADELAVIDDELTRLEITSGREQGSISLVALLETALGILNAPVIAACPRVRRLAIGEADLGAELGVELTPGDEREMLSARSMLVLASSAAGIEPPVGPVSTDFRDLDALRASSEALKRFGFRGRSCIHPAQVVVVNDVFTPTPAEVAKARRLVELYDAAVAAGDGVIADENGKMIDEAVVRSARRTLAQGAPQ
jgi:citrate lyase subunit beta / citryl-CoA lyase